ncbi:hypothetical protein [Mycobacterium talmoniae]|nr:hypothetical protein [Mycobacterium talmoniae]
MVYTPVRRVEGVIGRGVKGGRLLLGPYKKREIAPLLGGICLATSLALTEFPILGSILNGGARASAVFAAVAVMLLVLAVLCATFGWVAWHRGGPAWPPQHVRNRARINQWRRRPVYVSGRDRTSPPPAWAGGKVRVRA